MERKGIIFDLDGTLINSQLDFTAMRKDMGIGQHDEILSAIENELDPKRRLHMQNVVENHERTGVAKAQLFPGAQELFAWLETQQIKKAIFTRNSRRTTEIALEKFQLKVDIIVSREDASPKPDPIGLFKILQSWLLRPEEVIFVGDFLIDLEAGAKAEIQTILFTGIPPEFNHNHPHVISELLQLKSYFQRGPLELPVAEGLP